MVCRDPWRRSQLSIIQYLRPERVIIRHGLYELVRRNSIKIAVLHNPVGNALFDTMKKKKVLAHAEHQKTVEGAVFQKR